VESKLIHSSKRQIPSGVIYITSERALLPRVYQPNRIYMVMAKTKFMSGPDVLTTRRPQAEEYVAQ
jgi:hypothetical protein